MEGGLGHCWASGPRASAHPGLRAWHIRGACLRSRERGEDSAGRTPRESWPSETPPGRTTQRKRRPGAEGGTGCECSFPSVSVPLRASCSVVLISSRRWRWCQLLPGALQERGGWGTKSRPPPSTSATPLSEGTQVHAGSLSLEGEELGIKSGLLMPRCFLRMGVGWVPACCLCEGKETGT